MQHPADVFLPSPATLLHGQNINLDDHISPRSGLEEDNTVQGPEFGQVIDVNLSPWAEFYPTGNVIQLNTHIYHLVQFYTAK